MIFKLTFFAMCLHLQRESKRESELSTKQQKAIGYQNAIFRNLMRNNEDLS